MYLYKCLSFTYILFFLLLYRSIFIQMYSINKHYTSLSFFQMWYLIAYYITNKNSSIAVSRYGDGENNIMNKKYIKFNSQAIKVDKFHYNGGNSKLGNDLNISLSGQYGRNYFYCIPFFNPLFTELFYRINQRIEYVLSANIFVNSNYYKTKQLLFSLLYDEYKQIILFCNKAANYTHFAEEIIYFPDEIVEFYERNKENIINKVIRVAKKYNNRLFIVSVGPLSEVLIWNMFNVNPNNRYIDFGSSTDELLKQKATRAYVDQKSKISHKIDPIFIKNSKNKIIFK